MATMAKVSENNTPTPAPDIPSPNSSGDGVELAGAVGKTALWVAFLAMVASALAIYIRSLYLPREQRFFSAVSFAICAFASTAYLTMACDTSVYYEPNLERTVYWGRYIDWLVTTPLLLLDLGSLAGLHNSDLFMAISWDVVMILAGLAGGLTHNPQLKWPLWLLGCVAMLFVFHQLVGGVQLATSKRPEYISSRYKQLMILTIILWTLYPVVWAFGEGTGYIDINTEIVLYAILDVAAKVVFSLLLLVVRPDEATTGNEMYSPIPGNA